MNSSAPHSFIQKGRPALVLAPMEGVTDYPIRVVQSALGGFDYCITEFIRVSGHALTKRGFKNHIPEWKNEFRTPSGHPVQVQLLGGHAGRLAGSALAAVNMGARAIDLNFGCPAPTVNRHDGGATLLKHPERIEEIVREVRSALPTHVPVSAKLRLGWDSESAIVENARCAEAGGAAWLTIHARTKMQGYQPPAYWKWIGEARRAVSIPVVANGDIWNVDDFEKCREMTGAEHFMIGRGALANPALSLEISRRLGIRDSVVASPDYLTSVEAWLPLLERFAAVSIEAFGRGPYVAKRVKQWLHYSARYNRTPWFEELKRTESLEEMLSGLRAILARERGVQGRVAVDEAQELSVDGDQKCSVDDDQKCSTSYVLGASKSSSTQQPSTVR